MEIHNQEYLKAHQYKTPDCLKARIYLHRRFSSNPQGFYPWLLSHFDLQPGERVLEVGCGPGEMWSQILPFAPQPLRLTLSDFSPGMARQAAQNLASAPDICWLVMDVQNAAFAAGCFDVVIANHMLYHVPDISRAVAESARLLRPGGRFFAATNGARHMLEMNTLLDMVTPGVNNFNLQARRFSLENAHEYVNPIFGASAVQTYPDSLQVNEVAPLLSYIASMFSLADYHELANLEALQAHIQAQIAQQGSYYIGKSVGLVCATLPGGNG